MVEPDAYPEDDMTDYYLCEAALVLAAAKPLSLPALFDAMDPPPQEPLFVTLIEPTKAIIATIQRRLDAQEALTTEFLTLIVDTSRQLYLVEAAAAADKGARLTALQRHVKRLEEVRAAMKFAGQPLDGPPSRHDYDYDAAEARLWAAQENGGTAQSVAAERGAMAGAARAEVSSLWKRKDAGQMTAPESVHAMCAWFRRLRLLEQHSRGANDPAIRPDDHLRRMRALYADLKRRFDEGVDVSMVEVREAAYFLREAELSLVKPDPSLRQ
jgi:hypothetical protein